MVVIGAFVAHDQESNGWVHYSSPHRSKDSAIDALCEAGDVHRSVDRHVVGSIDDDVAGVTDLSHRLLKGDVPGTAGEFQRLTVEFSGASKVMLPLLVEESKTRLSQQCWQGDQLAEGDATGLIGSDVITDDVGASAVGRKSTVSRESVTWCRYRPG